MGRLKEYAQDLAEALGYENINHEVLEIGQDILDARILEPANRGLRLAKIAKRIRRERVVKVCAYCGKVKLGDTYEKVKYVPKGHISHGMCQRCYNEMIKEVEA